MWLQCKSNKAKCRRQAWGHQTSGVKLYHHVVLVCKIQRSAFPRPIMAFQSPRCQITVDFGSFVAADLA